ncbi:hypothetical protein [Actinomycetospora atypica]|uniref:Uncharacterized protein n=1 Tax=Actinomycetospora atypica TaxID=1290095 RepID=A0ABV9YWA5_9PSEU
MTDEPEDRSEEDGVGSGPASSDRPGLLAGEAAAIARFGEGPALFSVDVPAPRHPHHGPLLPHGRVGHHPAGPPVRPSTDLVVAPVRVPARRAEDTTPGWVRAGVAAWHGVEAAVDWTARTVVAAATALGTAAQTVVGRCLRLVTGDRAVAPGPRPTGP